MTTVKDEITALGILTIAFGDQYLALAKNLSKSLALTNPNLQKAVITDGKGLKVLEKYFDVLIPLKKVVNSNLEHKLKLIDYSPYQDTLFIDSDCLIFKDIIPMINILSRQSFANVGEEINKGEWYMDVSTTLKKFKLNSIPQLNGGIYFFKKDFVAQEIQSKALEIAKNYFEIGLKPFSDGGINEEPVYALSMAQLGLSIVSDPEKITMYTPLGLESNFYIDILNQKTSFKKRGCWVNPSIVHFCGGLSNGFHYKREIFKLNLLIKNYPKLIVAILAELCYNLPYASFVFLKRLAKKLSGRKNIKFTPLLPLYSNH